MRFRRAGKGLFFKLFQSLQVEAVGFLVEVLHDLDVISTAEDLCQSGYDAQGHDLAGWFQFQPWWDELCRDEPEFLN